MMTILVCLVILHVKLAKIKLPNVLLVILESSFNRILVLLLVIRDFTEILQITIANHAYPIAENAMMVKLVLFVNPALPSFI